MQHSFSFQELNGKTVEYQTQNEGSFFGKLRPLKMHNGSLQLQIDAKISAGTVAPEAQTLDPNHLLKHPLPSRAEYLLAEDAEYLLRTIRADTNM